MTSHNKKSSEAKEEALFTEDEPAVEQIQEESEVDKLTVALKQSEDKYIRSLAEAENTRRRYDKMVQDTAKFAVADFAKETLNISDIFDKAFSGIDENSITNEEFKNFLAGIRLTKKELEKTMTKFGIVKIGEIGEKFNPHFHEAMYAKPDKNAEDDSICEIFEHGYKIHDRLLRSAKVGIIKN